MATECLRLAQEATDRQNRAVLLKMAQAWIRLVEQAREPVVARSPSSSSPSISIVDDDDQVRSSIESLLRALDYTVHTFASAEDFLASPQLHHTACVISDMRMPGLSGVELQVVLDAKGHHIPMILLTAHADEHVRERAMRAGAVSFMSKPISESDLILCLDRALKKV